MVSGRATGRWRTAIRVWAAAAALLAGGGCGGTLEDDYRRNQRTPGTGTVTTATTAPGQDAALVSMTATGGSRPSPGP